MPEVVIARLGAEAGDPRWRDVERLFRDYAVSLPVDLAYQGFDAELADLSAMYGTGRGAAFLALLDGDPAGCVGVRQHPLGAELKRLYVSADARGHDLGRRLTLAAIGHAKRMGFASLVLDTLPSMTRAQNLYAALGFKPIEPYYDTPVAGTAFLALDLTQNSAAPRPVRGAVPKE